jgi:hypothetical protein
MLRFALTGLVSFSRFPLRAAGAVGFLLILLGAATGVLALADAFEGAATERALILTAIFLVGGVQLVFTGVLGEYLGAVLDEVRARPHYIVEERINLPPSATSV